MRRPKRSWTRLFGWWFFKSDSGALHFAGDDKKGRMELSEQVRRIQVRKLSLVKNHDRLPVVVVVTSDGKSEEIYLGALKDCHESGYNLPIDLTKIKVQATCEEDWFHQCMPSDEICPYCKWESKKSTRLEVGEDRL